MMSTPTNTLSHAEIAREIRAVTGEHVSTGVVGSVRRKDTTSARVSALVEKAVASLMRKAARKQKRPVAP
jgi:hypothetical protein